MGNASSVTNTRINVQLDFIIDRNQGQQELNQFGYYFTRNGQCSSTETDEKCIILPSPQQYEKVCCVIQRYIFYLLRQQYKMDEKIIDDTDCNKSNHMQPHIFLSTNYGRKQTLLLLIPRIGSARAGQWSRSSCINHNLSVGTMFGYISEAHQRDWGVVIFDPNATGNKQDAFSHISLVYNNYIEKPCLWRKKTAIQHIVIVCAQNSDVLVSKLITNKNSKIYLKPKICGIAGIDTDFNDGTYDVQSLEMHKIYGNMTVNWMKSSKAIGAFLSTARPLKVSAGHKSDKCTASCAAKRIMDWFDIKIFIHNKSKNNKNDDNNNDVQTVMTDEKDVKLVQNISCDIVHNAEIEVIVNKKCKSTQTEGINDCVVKNGNNNTITLDDYDVLEDKYNSIKQNYETLWEAKYNELKNENERLKQQMKDIGIDEKMNEEELRNSNEIGRKCRNKFKEWLFYTAKWSRYLSNFEENDCNDIRMIEHFEIDSLKEMGVNNSVHRKSIMKHVEEYKQLQSDFNDNFKNDQQLKQYKKVFRENGILILSDLQNEITTKNVLSQLLQITNKTDIDYLWDMIHSDINDEGHINTVHLI